MALGALAPMSVPFIHYPTTGGAWGPGGLFPMGCASFAWILSFAGRPFDWYRRGSLAGS